jgi:arsenate reductase
VKILEKECNSFRIIEYLKESIDKKTIQDILNILNVNAVDLIRKNEKEFKDLNLSENEINNSNLLIDLIIKYPKIMQRPIILNENRGVIGKPPKNIYNIL